MPKKILSMKTVFATTVLALIVMGCSNTPTKLDQHFGESTRNMLSQQVINPHAGEQANGVTALDGRSAKEVIFNYYQSYNKPVASPNAMSFTVGNGANSGMPGAAQ